MTDGAHRAHPHLGSCDYLSQSTSFFKHLEHILHQGHSFFDFQMLGNLSATSRSLHARCEQLWLAFAKSNIFEDTSILRIKDFSDNRPFQTMLIHARNSCSIGLLRVLHTLHARAVEEAFFMEIECLGRWEDAGEQARSVKRFDVTMRSGIDIFNARNSMGDTGLILGVHYKQPVVIKMIIDHLNQLHPKNHPSYLATKNAIRAFIEARDHHGDTALTIAKRQLNGEPDFETREKLLACIRLLTTKSKPAEYMKWLAMSCCIYYAEFDDRCSRTCCSLASCGCLLEERLWECGCSECFCCSENSTHPGCCSECCLAAVNNFT